MCLSIIVDRPDALIEKGEAHGLEYVITHNGRGFRCGYVRVPIGHPMHGKDWDEVDYLDVHGGITFAEADKPCDKGGKDNAWWLGFDCAHYDDAQDPSLPHEWAYPSAYLLGGGTSIKTTEFVRRECFSLAEQISTAGLRS